MDTRLLRYFIACVEHRTMHAAALAVHVSQPALSKAVAGLEAELGVTLLERHPRGVTPTAYGETLFRYAKMIDSDMRHAIAELDAMRGMTRGTIVIGVIPTMSALIGEVARIALERHPGLKLKLKVAFSVELLPALAAGALDLCLLLPPAEDPPPGFTIEPMIEAGPVVVVRRTHPLATQPRCSLDELAAYPWLIPDYPASHRAVVHRAFIDAGLPPPIAAVDVSTVIFFESLIAQSDLVSVVPLTLLNSWSGSDLVALPTEFAFPREQVCLAFRSSARLLPGARTVLDIVREVCAAAPGGLGGSASCSR